PPARHTTVAQSSRALLKKPKCCRRRSSREASPIERPYRPCPTQRSPIVQLQFRKLKKSSQPAVNSRSVPFETRHYSFIYGGGPQSLHRQPGTQSGCVLRRADTRSLS